MTKSNHTSVAQCRPKSPRAPRGPSFDKLRTGFAKGGFWVPSFDKGTNILNSPVFSWEQESLVSEHPLRLKMQNLLPETAILGESGNGSSFWCVKYISAFRKGGKEHSRQQRFGEILANHRRRLQDVLLPLTQAVNPRSK